MSELRISVGLPQLLPVEGPEVVTRYAIRAEELGFAGLWSLDSVPGSATSRVALLDGLHLLTSAAAVTDTISLGIAVIVLAARNVPQLARELATIDRLSGGRVIVGVGVGRKEPSAAGLGLPAEHRARRLEEGVEVLRSLWADGEAALQRQLLPVHGRDARAQARPAPRATGLVRGRQPNGAASRGKDGRWLGRCGLVAVGGLPGPAARSCGRPARGASRPRRVPDRQARVRRGRRDGATSSRVPEPRSSTACTTCPG